MEGQNKHILEKINLSILEKYKSLEEPNYLFVMSSYNQNIYQELVDELKSNFEVFDETGLNEDVCLILKIIKNKETWYLLLSFVGRYALLAKMNEFHKFKSVITEKTINNNDENQIIKFLKKNSFLLLDEEILSVPFPMKKFYTDDENVRLYQVLFSDYDSLPWE